MNNELFRKVALDKLSSPEQLDQTMRVAGPLYWTSLLAILVALTAAGVWSLTGSIPTKSIGEGTIIRPGGVYNISSSGTGLVKDFKVRVGDHVSVNQVVAEIDQPLSNDDIAAAEQHLVKRQLPPADLARVAIEAQIADPRQAAVEKPERAAREREDRDRRARKNGEDRRGRSYRE